MTGVWAFLHLLGLTLWLGGAFASMAAGIAAKKRGEPRSGLAAVARTQGALHTLLIGPGAFLTVLSGLILTIRLYGAMRDGAPSLWLVVMQITGVLAGLLALFVAVPTASRVARIDPEGPHGAAFDVLRSRQAVVGSIGGVLGLLALLSAALLKYPG